LKRHCSLSSRPKEVFSIAEGALLICLEKELTQELIDAMAAMEPSRVICLDAGFQGNDQLKANAVQTFKAHARNKETAIEFRTV
jgi:adenine-specific DNA-methyltransferase